MTVDASFCVCETHAVDPAEREPRGDPGTLGDDRCQVGSRVAWRSPLPGRRGRGAVRVCGQGCVGVSEPSQALFFWNAALL